MTTDLHPASTCKYLPTYFPTYYLPGRAPPAPPPLPRLPVSSGGCGSRELLKPKALPSPPPPPPSPRLGRRVGGYGLRFLLLLVVVFLLYCGLGVAYRHACALIVNCMCTGFAPHVH